jgi:Asp-tRNA(Asn)/Glu-tRNA(Gln) amidotransferase A subunit family amidase
MVDSIGRQIDGLDAVALAKLVRQGEITANELLSVTLARVDRLHPQLNAVVERFDDLAQRHAADCNTVGPLAGVPIFLKALMTACAGAPFSSASNMLQGVKAPKDSYLTARLKASGAVIAGMTNSPEMGAVTTTEPRYYGATHNPWHTGLSPGGSSGGAAAIVAAGISPVAHATDGGGSIRIPAACCGLVGLKPSRGRVSFGPGVGEGWAGMAYLNCVSTTVRDTAAFLDVVAGAELGDPYIAPPPRQPFADEVSVAPGAQRIGLCLSSFNGRPVNNECVVAARRAAAILEELGHHVMDIGSPIEPDQLAEVTGDIIAVNMANTIDQIGRMRGRPVAEEEVETTTWSLAKYGREISGPKYVAGVNLIHALGRQVAEQFTAMDLMLTPTMATPEIPLGYIDAMSSDQDAFNDALMPTIAFTSLFNATGQPALSLPIVTRDNGLPIGVQLVARYGEEGLLLRMAAQAEAAHPWAGRMPDLHVTKT